MTNCVRIKSSSKLILIESLHYQISPYQDTKDSQFSLNFELIKLKSYFEKINQWINELII